MVPILVDLQPIMPEEKPTKPSRRRQPQPEMKVAPAQPPDTTATPDAYGEVMRGLLHKGLAPPQPPTAPPPAITPWLLNEATSDELLMAYSLYQQYMDYMGFLLNCARSELLAVEHALGEYDASVRQAIRLSGEKCTKDEMSDMLALADSRKQLAERKLRLDMAIEMLHGRTSATDTGMRTISRSIEVRRQVLERDRTGVNIPFRGV